MSTERERITAETTEKKQTRDTERIEFPLFFMSKGLLALGERGDPSAAKRNGVSKRGFNPKEKRPTHIELGSSLLSW